MKTKIVIYLILFSLLLTPSLATAANVPNRGFSLSPGSFDELMAAGETKQETIFITNNTGNSAVFEIETEDFEASSDPKISTQLLGQNASSYSLKDYLKPELSTIVVENGQTRPLKVTISIPQGIASPGLYGAVLVKQKFETKAKESTSITPRIGVLFYVGLKGGFPKGAESVDLKYIPFDQVCKESGCQAGQEKSDEFAVSFQNGNKTHLSLYGDIEIKNILGKKVDTVKVNPWFVMADTLKMKEVKWKSPQYLFGLYKATVKLSDYHSSDVRERSIYFWVLPWQMVVIIFLLSLIVFFILKLVFSKFRKAKVSKEEYKPTRKTKGKK